MRKLLIIIFKNIKKKLLGATSALIPEILSPAATQPVKNITI